MIALTNQNYMKIKLFFAISTLSLLAACGGSKSEQPDNTDSKTETPTFKEGMKIGYYHSDSINEHYKLITAIQEDLEKELNQMSIGFETKVKNFENWARSYDEKMKNNMLISSEIQKFQEQFQQRQMALAQEEQQLQAKMQQLQNDNLVKAFNRIEAYVKTYAEENEYDLILQYAKGGQVIYISPAMDVTNDIVKGLNADYDTLNSDEESN
jgi:outer membrane protein